MNFMTFNMDCSKRSCRAKIFACSAADASLFVDSRDSERVLIIRILFDHSDRSCRTVAGAVPAAYIVFVDNACVEIYDCMSYLDRGLLFNAYRLDRSYRTYL